MSLPVLFEGYMMLQDIGNDDPVPYLKPLAAVNDFREAYSSFIKPTEVEARGKIARDHVDYLNDLNDAALARLEDWEPSAYVMKVSVDYRGDIRIEKDHSVITREDVFESAMMEIPDTLLASIPLKVEADADFRSSDVQFAVTYFRSCLDRPDELLLFNAIIDRVSNGDSEFEAVFIRWLSPEGGTVILRDDLCRPFKPMFADRKVEGRQNLAWDNAWTGIDSVRLAYREEFRVGGLQPATQPVGDEWTVSGALGR